MRIIHRISLIAIPTIIFQKAIPTPRIHRHRQVRIVCHGATRRFRSRRIPFITFIETGLERVDGDFASEIGHGDVVGGTVVGGMADLVLREAFLDVRCAIRGRGRFGAVAGEFG